MNNQKEAGEFAFPIPESDVNYLQTGMMLRDYFAAKALNVFASQYVIDEDRAGQSEVELLAKDCYRIADAFIKARSENVP